MKKCQWKTRCFYYVSLKRLDSLATHSASSSWFVLLLKQFFGHAFCFLKISVLLDIAPMTWAAGMKRFSILVSAECKKNLMWNAVLSSSAMASYWVVTEMESYWLLSDCGLLHVVISQWPEIEKGKMSVCVCVRARERGRGRGCKHFSKSPMHDGTPIAAVL